jgi:outer membrane protein TolC
MSPGAQGNLAGVAACEHRRNTAAELLYSADFSPENPPEGELMRTCACRFFRALFLLPLLVFLLAPLSGAQTLTLRRAVELALGHSSALAVSTADEVQALETYREARNAFIPQLAVGSGLAYSYGFPLSLEGSAPTVFNVTSQSPLLNLAQHQFARAARVQWTAAGDQARDQRSRVVLDAALTYAEIDYWQSKVDVWQHESELGQEMERAVAERVQEGIDSTLEQTKAKLATAQILLRIAQGRGAEDEARTHLSQLTGLPLSAITTARQTIPPVPPPPSAEQAVDQAVETSPVLRAADEAARARQLRASGEHRALLPAIDMVMQYGLINTSLTNYEQFFVPGSFQTHNTTAGLLIRFPFLNASQKAHARAADAEFVHAHREAEGLKGQITLEALKLQHAVEQASAARDVADLQAQVAAAEQGAAQARMQAGTATLKEAQNAMLDADEHSSALLDANFGLQRAQLQLLRATGALETWALGRQ